MQACNIPANLNLKWWALQIFSISWNSQWARNIWNSYNIRNIGSSPLVESWSFTSWVERLLAFATVIKVHVIMKMAKFIIRWWEEKNILKLPQFSSAANFFTPPSRLLIRLFHFSFVSFFRKKLFNGVSSKSFMIYARRSGKVRGSCGLSALHGNVNETEW